MSKCRNWFTTIIVVLVRLEPITFIYYSTVSIFIVKAEGSEEVMKEKITDAIISVPISVFVLYSDKQ